MGIAKDIFSSISKLFSSGKEQRHVWWESLPEFEKERLHYGNHENGFGVYRYDPKTFEVIEWWPDFDLANKEEISHYEDWCRSRGLIPNTRPPKRGRP